jgi:two-component system, cell cycle sensor histidine kinase and response regulator CckA
VEPSGVVSLGSGPPPQAEQGFAGLVDALPIGVVEVGLDRVVRYVNPAMVGMYGLRPEDIVGRVTPMVGETRAWYEQVWDDLLAGRPLIGHHARRRHVDGSSIDVRISYVPAFDDQGQVVGAIGIHEDVTERARLEEQLRQAQKMEAVGQLAGGVAHDFNNLLTVIGGNLELALSLLPPDAAALPFLQEIREANRRAAAVASQLLSVARPQTGRVERFEVGELVTSLEGLLTRAIGVSTPLHVSVQPAPGWVEGDPSQLEQVLMNLVLNARDASPDGSPIEVRVAGYERDSRHWVRLEVADTGVGMDASTRERVFEPFFTTKERSRGTGLGLATSYGIVTRWQGRIELHSELGRGTLVQVDLPAVGGEGAASEGDRSSDVVPVGDGTGVCVLLVEDESSLRALVERALTVAGFVVAAGATLEEARAGLPPGTRPDVLVTDVVLIGERGTEVAAELHRTQPAVPVLFVSGYAGGDDGRSALPPDAAFLAKPFRIAELVERILELVDVPGPTRNLPRD